LPINQCNARPQATNRKTKIGALARASAERNCKMTEIPERRTGCEPAQIDLAELEDLSFTQCTDKEMAAYFQVSIETLEKPEFAAVIERGRAAGRASLLTPRGNADKDAWLMKRFLRQQYCAPEHTGATRGSSKHISLRRPQPRGAIADIPARNYEDA
jgi:hypothetical protein